MNTTCGTDGAAPGPTPLDLPLDGGGTTFIEASAGTGKTHALTTLVARLVVEEEWPIDRILVVTFTRAAISDLRNRIRRVLGATLVAVRAHVRESGPDAGGPDPETVESGIDPQARELLAAWERMEGRVDYERAARRLQAAMHDIDRANVFTIHGFCQRVLADLAFESGFPFGCEVGGDDGEMVAGAVRDFWRRRLYSASMSLMRHAFERGFLPDGLAGWVTQRRAKIGAELVGGDPPAEPMEAREAAWRAVFDATRSEWERHGDDFCAEIREGRWLNRSSYRVARVSRELAGLEALFAASEPRLPAEGAAGRYGRERLSDACKRGFTLPANPLFDALDRLDKASRELRAAYDQWLRWMRREALTDIRESVRRRIRTDRRLAYDDLLIELDDALGGAGGVHLAARIRREFPCALIDEYQDTDPVQARIFRRIYGGVRAESTEFGGARPGELAGMSELGTDRFAETAGTHGTASLAADPSSRTEAPEPGGPVEREGPRGSTRSERPRPGPFVVVGDPKQSIYRFRGADVFAYLAARRAARERLHLDRNWRSVPALVEAVNAVFAGADPFVVPEIEYRPVTAAGDGDNPLRFGSGEGGGSLEFWLLPRAQADQPFAKKDANAVVAGVTAHRIARLLELGARGEATVEDWPLTGADIAVLVRTREQGRLIAGALHERGVRSIEIDDGSVYRSREAEQLERLLWCVVDQGREARVRGALAGDMIGLDAQALLTLGDDERAWSAWAGRLAQWRAHWELKGIGSVLLRLLEREGGAQRLLGHRDGARRLTNYRHLAELLQEAEARERFAPAELAAWLNHRRRESSARDDDVKLRIESDEQLVKILTVHGSKGLEFPVVFCPFAWDAHGPGRRRDAVDAVYHRGAADDYREVVDLDPDERAEAVEWLEEFAESVRLLYVALTRAKYRCVVAWGQVRGAEHAPLAWLLHRSADEGAPDVHSGPTEVDAAAAAGGKARDTHRGSGDTDTAAGKHGLVADDDTAIVALRAAADRFVGLDASEWLAEIDAFARHLPGAVSAVELDPEPPSIHAPTHPEEPPAALAAREPRRQLQRIRSLTSFSALSTEALPTGRGEAELDRPDHDQHEEPADVAGGDTGVAAAAAGERTAFTFPRGPVAGSCLHRIFESLDAATGMGADRRDLDEICGDALGEFGIDEGWAPVARAMVERTRSVLLRAPEPERADANAGAGSHAGLARRTDAGGAPGPGEGTGGNRDTNPDPATDAHGKGNAFATDGRSGVFASDGFRLDGPHRRLVELEFHFPVEGLDRARLAARLVEHGYPDPFLRAGRIGTSESPPPMHGFMRGFIDLVVEHAGRWYVLDYKSNWLGPGPGDYGPGELGAAVRAGGYALQSLIYLVAVHRYLRVRLPGYEYERHVGGAFYLFVRGIDPDAGVHRGVYFDRPSTACLLALDDCFRGGGA